MRDSITKANKRRQELLKKNKNKLYSALSVIVLLVLWKGAALLVDKSVIVPSPEETVSALWAILSDPEFFIAVGHTMKRVVIGFSITLFCALSLGFCAGFFPPLYHLFHPVVTVFRSVPTMAVILLALIWLQSEKAPILVAFLVTFPILYQNVLWGIRNVDQKLIEMAYIYKVSKVKVIWDIYMPSIRTYLLAGISTALGLTVKIVIAAEVLSQPAVSIGTGFQMEKAQLNTAGVFAWSVVAIVLAGCLDWIVGAIHKIFLQKRFDDEN